MIESRQAISLILILLMYDQSALLLMRMSMLSFVSYHFSNEPNLRSVYFAFGKCALASL